MSVRGRLYFHPFLSGINNIPVTGNGCWRFSVNVIWSTTVWTRHSSTYFLFFFFFIQGLSSIFFFCLMIFQHLKTLKCFYLQKKNSSEVKFNNNLQCFYSCWNCQTRPGPKYMNENVKSSTAARWRSDMFFLNYISSRWWPFYCHPSRWNTQFRAGAQFQIPVLWVIQTTWPFQYLIDLHRALTLISSNLSVWPIERPLVQEVTHFSLDHVICNNLSGFNI